MSTLTPHECRVLGVLIEKAQTTAAQYPLTLNALISGSNQKSNRDPVLTLNEDQVLEAIDGLRSKELVREVMLSGSRVQKFRHVARESLELSTSELVVLAELMLRGPQTLGEIRGRASRMHPLESLEITSNVLSHLMERDPPFARSVPPAPGSRASRFGQLLCPDLHRIEVATREPGVPALPSAGSSPSAVRSTQSDGPANRGSHAFDELSSRLGRLEAEVGALKETVHELNRALGTP